MKSENLTGQGGLGARDLKISRADPSRAGRPRQLGSTSEKPVKSRGLLFAGLLPVPIFAFGRYGDARVVSEVQRDES